MSRKKDGFECRLILLILSLAMDTLSEGCQVVDLSHWNKEVDFGRAKASGLVGVIHKATQGVTFVDATNAERRREAAEAGVLWGAYHFGTNSSTGDAQAKFFLDTVGSHEGVLLALDLEPNGSKTMTLPIVEEFLEKMLSSTGKLPLVYGPPSFLSDYLPKSSLLASCPLWVAHWTDKPQPTLPKGATTYVLWQYSDGAKGGTPRTIAGIGSPVDCNRYNGQVDEMKARWADNLAKQDNSYCFSDGCLA